MGDGGRILGLSKFLKQVPIALVPSNLFGAVTCLDVMWNVNGTEIGQSLNSTIGDVDYVCPMSRTVRTKATLAIVGDPLYRYLATPVGV